MDDVRYWIDDGALFVANATTGKVIWHGRVEGYPVLTVLPSPSSADCIVLLAWYRVKPPGDFPNVLRCRYDGTVVWRAQMPVPNSEPGGDYYTEVWWAKDGKLMAYAASAYAVHLDVDTGRIISKEWVK